MSEANESAVPDTTSDDFERVLAAAEAAAPVLAASAGGERADWLNAIADALDGASSELVAIARDESHLTEARLTGELVRTTFQLRLFGREIRTGSHLRATIDHADADWPMGARPDLRRMLRPIGPVAMYAASNFPFAFSVAGGDTAAAIAAGAPVVVKANPGHPRLSAQVARIVTDTLSGAGAPDGAFAIVYGLQIGSRLVSDPRIAAASFTGSLSGGRALFDLASAREHPIPFYGELGSVNPVFVTPAAASVRMNDIIAGFLGSVTLGVGQFCTKPGFLFVPASASFDDVVARFVAETSAAPMLNDHIRGGYERVLDSLVGHPAVRVVARGDSDAGSGAVAPTVLATTAPDLLANTEALMAECFGPTALIVSYSSESELFAAAAAFDGQLTATVVAESGDSVGTRLVSELAAIVGRVLWNSWPTGVSVTYAMQHGGPYPATTSVGFTSVGTASIDRFLRPVAYQNTPQDALPPELRDGNPLGVPQRINGV